MIAVVKTKQGYGEFDWVHGFRGPMSTSRCRNFDDIAAQVRTQLVGLKNQRREIEQRLEELCLEDEANARAIREAEETLGDLMEVAHPFHGE